MKDWKALAAAMGASVAEPDRVFPVLDALERDFRPLVKQIPHDVEPPLVFRPYAAEETEP